MPLDALSSPPDSQYQSLTGCLLRAFWIVIGNLVLVFCLIAIVRHSGQLFSVADGIFWGVGLLQIVFYYVDMRWLDGGKVLEVRSHRRHRFPFIFGTLCVTAWLLAHLIAFLLSSGELAT